MNDIPRRSVRKVLLIRPPATIAKAIEAKPLAVPLGLAYLGAVLEEEYEVKILDALAEGFEDEIILDDDLITYGLKPEKIRETIADFSPDVVGVSCLFSVQFQNALDVCRIAKEVHADVITILGGAHPSARPREVLKEKEVDLVVIGEGEAVLKELLRAIEYNLDFSTIDGVAYKDAGTVTVNPKTKYIKDLDSLPFPARHLLPMNKYFEINRAHASLPLRTPNTVIVTSRGCPGRCVFCSIHTVWGKTYRTRSAENVLSEIEHLIKSYGIREVQFGDDNLILNRSRAKKIFEGIVSRNIDISWHAIGGIALSRLNEEMICLMKKSGCYRMSFPVESGDQYVLDNIIKKRLDLTRVPRLARLAKQHGIKTDALFVVGFPGETKQQVQNTLRYARSLPVYSVSFFFATPFPGTELLRMSRENGCLKPDFSYEYLRTGKPCIITPEFTRHELERMVAREAIVFRLLGLFRDPTTFFKKNVLSFITDRRYFMSFWTKSLKTLLLKQE